MESERNEFISLGTRFLFLNHYDESSSISVIELNLVLNELNAICFRHQQFADQKCALALIGAFPKIPAKEDTLIVKACCLIVSLVKKQKIRVPPNLANLNVIWLLKCLEKSFHAVICDALKALNVLFMDNVNSLDIHCDRLLSWDKGVLVKLIRHPKLGNSPEVKYEKNSEEDILLSALACVETLLSSYSADEAVTKIPEDFLPRLGDVVLRGVYKWELRILGEIYYVIFISRSLNILKSLVELNPAWLQENFGDILGAARTFMVTGCIEEEWLKPQRVTPSQQILLEPQSSATRKGGKVMRSKKGSKSNKKGKKPKTEEQNQFLKPYSYETVTLADSSEELITFATSESELSDSGGKYMHDMRQKKLRVRLTAIQLIGSLAKVGDQRTMFGYWHCLFSTQDTSLNECVVRDPSHRCRMNALQTICCLLHDSKKYLYQAESVEASSFTPFSVALGNMILDIYGTLFKALDKESLSPLIVQILKCFIALIPATPFHRLKPGIVTEIVKYIRKLVNHWESTVRLFAFRVMGYIISITDITPEITDCIGVERLSVRTVTEDIHRVYLKDAGEEEVVSGEEDEDSPQEEEKQDERRDSKMSWSLEAVLMCVELSGRATSEIHIECLNLLAAMSAHIGMLIEHLEAVAEVIGRGLRDKFEGIAVNSAKTLDFIAHSVTQYFLNGAPKAAELKSGVDFWLLVLPAVTELLQGGVTGIKVICCDALSNIGGRVYESLPRDKQFLVLSLLHGNTSNNETIVRASACRALSVFAQFPSLREDLVFVENTAEMVTDLIPIGDELSRMKAAWALGNITDLQHVRSENPLDCLRDDLLEKMFRISIAACDDQHKVRCNIVRAIGNLLFLIREELLMQQKWQEVVKTVIECLIVNARDVKFMKVRWNACYALGNMMRNPCFYGETALKRLNWQTKVFPALCDLIVRNPNFKVRINATMALGAVSQRIHYGQHFIGIWSSVIQALEQADNLVDFNEYKHRDNLMDQLCLTLAHLIKLAESQDVVAMQDELIPRVDMTRDNWSRVANRIVPERATPLLVATQKLKGMTGDKLPQDQLLASQFLASCFVSPIEYV